MNLINKFKKQKILKDSTFDEIIESKGLMFVIKNIINNEKYNKKLLEYQKQDRRNIEYPELHKRNVEGGVNLLIKNKKLYIGAGPNMEELVEDIRDGFLSYINQKVLNKIGIDYSNGHCTIYIKNWNCYEDRSFCDWLQLIEETKK